MATNVFKRLGGGDIYYDNTHSINDILDNALRKDEWGIRFGTISYGHKILDVANNTDSVNSSPRGISMFYTQDADDSPTKGSVSITIINKPNDDATWCQCLNWAFGNIHVAGCNSTVPSSLTWSKIVG